MDLNHGKSHHVGAASGLYFSAGEIGGALGPMIIGVLADVTEGFAVPLFMMTGVSVVLMLLLARLRYLMRG
jgi:CP family cyanate transporter-like MFS transporter